MVSTILKILGFIWLLPATILVWLFYIIPLLIFREVRLVGKADIFIWVIENPIDPTSWYDKRWQRWAGWSGPCVYIFKDVGDDQQNAITEIHEVKHCNDQFIWGVFFYPAYFFHSAWLGMSNLWKKREDKRHIYYDNYFERRARAAAGQLVDIPRSMWPDGPDDYNPWL